MDDRLDNLVIPVNKSLGLSTYDVIRRFRKVVRVRKVGHSGTLDPLATGLVLLLTGDATKLSSYLMDLPKTYIADIELGSSTDTNDAEGKVVETGDWSGVTVDAIRSILPSFLGRREQVPPMFSALKHKGVPLYTMARRGEYVERKPREVETYGLTLLECELPVFRVEIVCSKGMYVRVLAEEIGTKLGVPAHLKNLVRTRIGQFDVGSAVRDDELDGIAGMEKPGFGLAEALSHLKPVELDEQQLAGVRNGAAPRTGGPAARVGEFMRLLDGEGNLCAIAEAGPAGMMKLRRVFINDDRR
ncbi:MAG: tRNA pseudouridine(55) synthase TruB [Candidatus Krumholzibacteria bacterium]|nr:tRNA pseudouridine(55) synthase TruB [Candidatus Krumholzibacteria bacterium]